MGINYLYGNQVISSRELKESSYMLAQNEHSREQSTCPSPAPEWLVSAPSAFPAAASTALYSFSTSARLPFLKPVGTFCTRIHPRVPANSPASLALSLISSLRSAVTFLHVTLAKLSLPFFLPCTTVERPPYAQLCTCERSRSQLRSPPVPICNQAHSSVNVRPSLLRPSACK